LVDLLIERYDELERLLVEKADSNGSREVGPPGRACDSA
jgi:hypothetical protein